MGRPEPRRACVRVGLRRSRSRKVTGSVVYQAHGHMGPEPPGFHPAGVALATGEYQFGEQRFSLVGAAAVLKPGRMPERVSAASVNWLTSSRPPPHVGQRSVHPSGVVGEHAVAEQAFGHARHLRHRRRRVRPRPGPAGRASIAPTVSPSTSTSAWVTRWIRASMAMETPSAEARDRGDGRVQTAIDSARRALAAPPLRARLRVRAACRGRGCIGCGDGGRWLWRRLDARESAGRAPQPRTRATRHWPKASATPCSARSCAPPRARRWRRCASGPGRTRATSR